MSKVGIVGVGMVGRAAASAMVERGSCRELMLVDVRREVADAVALDLRYGISTGPALTVRSGTVDDLKDASLVAITAGANEKSGGATDKSDQQGRLRLLDVNAGIFKSIVPGAVLAVVIWLLASALFAFYVANFGSYNKTYGALGGVVIFLVWLWITNVAILLGAEFNAERERSKQLEEGTPGAERELQLDERTEPKDTKKARTA